MKLYNVSVEIMYSGYYDSSHIYFEQRLVVANSEEDSINFVKKDLSRIDYSKSCLEILGITSFHIDLDKVSRKRVVGYFKNK